MVLTPSLAVHFVEEGKWRADSRKRRPARLHMKRSTPLEAGHCHIATVLEAFFDEHYNRFGDLAQGVASENVPLTEFQNA
eukprot:2730257-Lingulodinium_polyedra.AAC.1